MSWALDIVGWQALSSQQQLQLMRIDKCVFIFPHTSKWDIFIYIIYRYCYPMFRKCLVPVGPVHMDRWGWIFSRLGCIRATAREERGGGMTASLVEEMNRRDKCILLISPKGTTAKREWRSGYYHIAKQVGCPVMVVGFDFVHHRLVFQEPFLIGDLSEQHVAARCQFDLRGIIPLNIENAEYPLTISNGTPSLVPYSRKIIIIIIIIISVAVVLLR